MSDNQNVTTQKVKIDTADAAQSLKRLNGELRATVQNVGKSLVESSKSFLQNEAQIRQWSAAASASFKNFGNELAENVKTGARALTLDLGREVLHKSARDATATAFSFSKAFAEIKSRSNASSGDLERWRRSIMQISTDTTANMDSMAESFKDMFSSVQNPDELLKIMSSIGDAAAMGDGDATKVSSFVKTSLTGQGREINKANVDDVINASDLLRRRGAGFKDLGDSMGALNGISGADMRKSGLSQRELASLMVGATNSGSSRDMALKGVQELIHMSANNGITQGSVLSSIIGGRSSMMKDGKFDVSMLGGNAYNKVLGLGGGDEAKALEVFKKVSGLSEEGAEATFNMIKNYRALNDSLEQAKADTKSFAQSAAEGKDNLENAYKGMTNSIVKGMSDILGGFEGPIKAVLRGNFGQAAMGLPAAGKQAVRGIVDNPALVIGALATTAATGALIRGLLPKMGGDAIQLGKGVAFGQALKQAGVTPVYVVNAHEISHGKAPGMDKISDLLMGGGARGAGTAAGGAAVGRAGAFLSKWGRLAGRFGGPALAIGAQGFEIYNEYQNATDDHGRKLALKKGGAGAVGGAVGAWGGAAAGAAVGTMALPGVGTAIGAAVGAAIAAYAGQYAAQKVVVEIDSKDPSFSARPKAFDNPRNAGSY